MGNPVCCLNALKAGPAACPAATAPGLVYREVAGAGRPAGPESQVFAEPGAVRRTMSECDKGIMVVVKSWWSGMRAWPEGGERRERGRTRGLAGLVRRRYEVKKTESPGSKAWLAQGEGRGRRKS